MIKITTFPRVKLRCFFVFCLFNKNYKTFVVFLFIFCFCLKLVVVAFFSLKKEKKLYETRGECGSFNQLQDLNGKMSAG